MLRFAILKKLSIDSLTRPDSIMRLNRQVRGYLKGEFPKVKWIAQYGLLGDSRPRFLSGASDANEEICVYDYLDIFEAPDRSTAAEVVDIVRSFGHATVELWSDASQERTGISMEDLAPYLGAGDGVKFEEKQVKGNKCSPCRTFEFGSIRNKLAIVRAPVILPVERIDRLV